MVTVLVWVVALVWVMKVVEAVAALASEQEEAATEQNSRSMGRGNIDNHNMDSTGSHNSTGMNNTGTVPHNNQDRGYIPHIPPPKPGKLAG